MPDNSCYHCQEPRAKSQEPRAKSQEPRIFLSFRRLIRRIIDKLLINSFSPSKFWHLRNKAINRKGLSGYFYNLMYSRYLSKFNGSIPKETQIDDLPVFPHGISGVFISMGAKIGKNCTIFHQVTIGSNTLTGSSHQGAPVIGDNVFIGCGAKIIGGVHVGSNVCIGANCVITKDIPDNSTAVMPGFRVLPRASDNIPVFTAWGEYSAEHKD